MTDDESPMTSVEYERLTRDLIERISSRATVATTRLEHNVQLPGRATPHQIDVVWEFTNDSGASHRVIFECKNRGRNLEQNAVLAFRGVMEEVGFQSVPTTGVIVHLTGYQSGARKVAETYGVVILELRDPLDKDVSDRVMGVRVSFTGIVPRLSNLQVDETEVLSSTALSGPVLDSGLQVEDSAGRQMSVVRILTDGESMTPTGETVPEHRVTRSFDPPATLLVGEEPAARIRAISATVWGKGATRLTSRSAVGSGSPGW
jgi:hypothetical protein